MKEETVSPMDRDLSGSYLFISFDLVNSTAFKNSDPHWPPLFNNFFDHSQISTRNYFPKCQTWKMIGDEILFYMPVEDIDELLTAPQKVYTLLQKSIKFLEKECKSKGILSVKATMWASRVMELRHSEFYSSGVNYLLKSHNGDQMVLDFLGPDIDTGFRIGSFALHGKLVVGADLACLISDKLRGRKEYDELEKLRIVSFEQLKGVWNSRHYPIIWYEEQWDNKEQLFFYDEEFTSPLVQTIIDRKICETPNIEKLTKVFKDLSLEGKTDQLLQGIRQYHTNNWGQDVCYNIPTERLSELHLVAFCFNDQQELLIGRNEKDGIWDFGLAYLMKYQNIEESLLKSYSNDFGITLEEINNEFPPVATYSVIENREKRTIPGIMCLADIGDQAIVLDPFRYKEFRFITRENAKDIVAKEAVEGFHERVEMAFSVYERVTTSCSENVEE